MLKDWGMLVLEIIFTLAIMFLIALFYYVRDSSKKEKIKQIKQSKLFRLIGVILLLIAISHLPYGYYIFLRISITVLSVYMIFIAMSRNRVGWS
jgi:cobalamin synthase